MAINTHFRELEAHLAGWLLRLRWREGLLWAVRGLAGGLAAALGLALVARAAPFQPVPVLIALAAALAAAGAVIGLGVAFAWPRPKLRAARRFDRLFGLAERTSAALELAARPEQAPDWLRHEQWADAAQAARGVRPGRALPLWAATRRDLGGLALVLAALILALALPNPQQAVLAQQRAVQQEAAAQAEAIEKLIQQIAADPRLTEAQKDALTEPLAQAQRELTDPQLTEAEAQQALAEAQQELRDLQDPQAEAQARGLQGAGEGLGQNATTQQAGEALQNGDLQQAGKSLAEIDPTQLSAAEKEALADQLDQTAQQLEATNPETAQSMREAADALRNGDDQAAREALQQAGEAVQQTGERAAQSEAARQASGEAQRAQQQIARAGQEGQQGQAGQQGQQGQGGGQQQGEGGGQEGQQGQAGQGGQQGQGQGTSGAGQGANGAGQGEGNGQAQGGQAGNQVGQGNGPGDGGERTYEPIYSPYRLGGQGGEDVTLPEQGNGDPGDEVVGQGPTDPQNPGEVTVPYNQVFPAYRDAAYSAVDEGVYPPELRDVVKDYFSSLEP